MKDELWIGDQVRVCSNGNRGIYRGEYSSDLARVLIGDEEVLVSFQDLEILEDEIDKNSEFIELEKSETDVIGASQLPSSIDLHIDILAPRMTNQSPHRILRFQVEACLRFITSSLEHGRSWADVIHGVGSGRLKEELLYHLDQMSEIKGTEVTGPGSIRVYFW